MLFKNIKTGNIVSPSDEATVELMHKSPIYEQIEAPAEAQTVADTETEVEAVAETTAEETQKPTTKKASKNK